MMILDKEETNKQRKKQTNKQTNKKTNKKQTATQGREYLHSDKISWITVLASDRPTTYQI